MKPSTHSRHATVLRVLVVLSCVCLLVIGLIALAVYRTLTVGGDLRAARNVVVKDLNVGYASKVEVSAHPWLVGLVRFGLSFAPLEPEARLALKSVRGAEVGVYQLASSLDGAQRLTLFRQVDDRLAKRGWSRMVTVFDRDNLVLVYAPAGELDPDEVEAFVLVLDGRDLVMVSGSGNLAPIAELVSGQLGDKLPAPFLAAWRH